MSSLAFDELSLALSYALMGASSSGASITNPVKKTESKKAAADDFDDMFGEESAEELNEDGETAEEAAATKARRDRMEKARLLKEEADAKAGKTKKAEKVHICQASFLNN